MNKFLIVIGLSISVIFTSCETDIDVNADYQDITVVYGVINPQDTTHYLKINKAFLGETSALDLAANSDNFTYAADEISVVVEEYNGSNNLVKTHSVVRTVNEIPKDPGTFDNSTNVLYKFVEPNINRYNKYRLHIINSKENKEVSAETKIVKPITVSTPKGAKFQFRNGSVSTGNFISKTIQASTGEDVGRVEARIVLNYVEHPLSITGKLPVYKKVVMPLGEQFTTTSLGNELLEWELEGETFFENIRASVAPITTADSLSHRELANITMEFSVAGTELHTYMVVAAPSSSVNQDKPDYTNIDNGVGIFSARENVFWETTIPPGQSNINDFTIRYLEYLGLGFCFGTGTAAVPCNQI